MIKCLGLGKKPQILSWSPPTSSSPSEKGRSTLSQHIVEVSREAKTWSHSVVNRASRVEKVLAQSLFHWQLCPQSSYFTSRTGSFCLWDLQCPQSPWVLPSSNILTLELSMPRYWLWRWGWHVWDQGGKYWWPRGRRRTKHSLPGAAPQLESSEWERRVAGKDPLQASLSHHFCVSW